MAAGTRQGRCVGGRDDFGRMREDPTAAKYAFRTRLRNVELTAPYGHDGAFFSLRDFVNHYSESAAKLMAFTDAHLEDALRGSVLNNKTDILSTRDPLLTGVFFTPQVLDEVTEFMKALTDSVARNLQGGHPAGFRVGYRSMASWGEGERRAVRVRGGRSGTRPLTVHLSPV